MANYLGYEFIDAATVICFDKDGEFDSEKTNAVCEAKFANIERAVVPGFYGAMPNGKVKTFSRGGSDVTGSIVARALKADMYENWTDVNGFLIADPRIVDEPKVIESITYKELRELSYMGTDCDILYRPFSTLSGGEQTRLLLCLLFLTQMFTDGASFRFLMKYISNIPLAVVHHQVIVLISVRQASTNRA